MRPWQAKKEKSQKIRKVEGFPCTVLQTLSLNIGQKIVGYHDYSNIRLGVYAKFHVVCLTCEFMVTYFFDDYTCRGLHAKV